MKLGRTVSRRLDAAMRQRSNDSFRFSVYDRQGDLVARSVDGIMFVDPVARCAWAMRIGDTLYRPGSAETLGYFENANLVVSRDGDTQFVIVR